LVQSIDGQAFQHADPFAEGFLEVHLPVHRAGGDGGNFLPNPSDIGELVKGFAGDDGAVHVGDQQAFAAATGPNENGVHQGAIERGADQFHVRGGCQRNVRGLSRRQDDRHPGAKGVADAVDNGRGERCSFPVGDEGEDVMHAAETGSQPAPVQRESR
jgi:hypothetical protein